MDGKHAADSFLSKGPGKGFNGKIELIDYQKLSDLPVSDFELMGYAIGILINRFNQLATIHNEKIDDEDTLI